MGALRQLKKSLEAFWRGTSTVEDLQGTAAELRRVHWLQQKEAGIDLIPCGDFSLYDHVLDTAAMVGAMPERFGWKGKEIDLLTYFAIARGKVARQQETGPGSPNAICASVHAMEMTKWFDTNYHYIVPEFHEDQKFVLSPQKSFRRTKRRSHSASRASRCYWDRAPF